MMQDARRIWLGLIYNNLDIIANLAPYLLSFSYTDYANGKADDLQINLEDRESLWKSGWMPDKGAVLQAALHVRNWTVDNEYKVLPLGVFEIDEIECSGPPEVVSVKALSLPESASLRGEAKTRAWEKTRLSVIANDIAQKAGLKLFYETDENPEYDRMEQTEQSDLSFLQKLCEDAGLSLKIANKQLVIFDDSKYEQQPPVMTITRGLSPVLSYQAVSSTANVYVAAQVAYKGAKQKKEIVYTYRPPNAPKTGKTLVINQRVSSLDEAMRLAKQRLRQANKQETKFNLTVMGNLALVAGVTVMLKGWGNFDDKYFIETAEHSGPNYTTRLELRRVLGW